MKHEIRHLMDTTNEGSTPLLEISHCSCGLTFGLGEGVTVPFCPNAVREELASLKATKPIDQFNLTREQVLDIEVSADITASIAVLREKESPK